MRLFADRSAAVRAPARASNADVFSRGLSQMKKGRKAALRRRTFDWESGSLERRGCLTKWRERGRTAAPCISEGRKSATFRQKGWVSLTRDGRYPLEFEGEYPEFKRSKTYRFVGSHHHATVCSGPCSNGVFGAHPASSWGDRYRRICSQRAGCSLFFGGHSSAGRLIEAERGRFSLARPLNGHPRGWRPHGETERDRNG